MEERKKNIPLIVALSIPVLMIVLIAAAIYLPALFVKPPKTNFIYSAGDYCYQLRYSVKGGKIIENQIKEENSYCRNSPPVKLFYYDVQSNTAREITLDEAAGLALDDSLKSPDGFEVAFGNYGSDFFFFSGSVDSGQYLEKGAYSRRLNIIGSNYGFKFIGWVKGDHHG